MKKLKSRLYPLFLSLMLLLSIPLTAHATGSGNIDSGGGSMGDGNSEDVWHRLDGVRITVVTTDGAVVSTPFDLSNANIPASIMNFGKVCKLQYAAGTGLSLSDTYAYSKPGTALPHIVSSNSVRASIDAIKRYFCSEYAAKLVAEKTGIAFDDLIGGSYKLLIEPVAYFTFGGVDYAMTAHEAAMYDIQSGGQLRRRMPSLTHKNLPLALFLETADLGYPAWTGPTTERVSSSDIVAALGMGIVSYADVPEEMLQAPDYTYRVDTDVITSIMLSTTDEINPDDPASVTFHIDGRDYTVDDIVIPENSSQVVWVKWHTPDTPTTIPITVTLDGGSTAKTSFIARVVSLEENLPPDPLATDTNPRFTIPSVPANPLKLSASWSVWSAHWHPFWEWEEDWEWEDDDCDSSCPADCDGDHGHWEDNGDWVDHGWYDFTSTEYSASISADMEIHPDDIVPTAQGDLMKSGYGIKEDVTARFHANAPSSHFTPVQTAVSYFPEFDYDSYWRLLACDGGNPAHLYFKPNEYSTYGRNVHFTPVWYPDDAYTVYTYVIDAWTPSGMLSMNVTDSIQIRGSLYDDWYSKRE